MSSEDYKVALAGRLPSGDDNGWDDDAVKQLLHDYPGTVRYARIAYSVLHTRRITATGKKILTVAVLKVEPIRDSMSSVEELAMMDLFEDRTGQTNLFRQPTDE